MNLALIVRIKPRARREINAAAEWWSLNRTAAPGAIAADLRAALAVLVLQPGIGTRVENTRDPETRRLHLARTQYFVYYRVKGKHLDVVCFWHSSRAGGPRL